MTASNFPDVVANLKWHDHAVTRTMREELNGHRGCTLWYTGLSGSGKSTLANEVSAALHAMGVRTYVLDGDNIRQGLNRGLSFSEEDRRENIRRIAEVAKLFSDAGLVTGAAFISPYREERALARSLQPDTFLEIHVKADLATCEKRDPKGLYAKARAGEIRQFTGIDAPYEEPQNPEVVVDTAKNSLADCARLVVHALKQRRLIP
ncbi:MAG: adenylyl-sulfate kinase [Candidatus Sumerlaeia bacterium]|nr:adenylyl-sulfate kinase [Candidatus Sumerlaeia bacterium]